MDTKREFRITRPSLYPKGTPGHTDPSARQGHYVEARSCNDACEQFRRTHEGVGNAEPLQCVQWDADS